MFFSLYDYEWCGSPAGLGPCSFASGRRFNKLANICVTSWHLLTLLLESLDVSLTVQVVLDGCSALLFGDDRRLLLWIVELDLHLVHFGHGRVCWSRAIGADLSLHLLLPFIVEQSRFGCNHVRLLLHARHSHGVLLVLTQVDLDARLRVPDVVIGNASI